MGRRIVVLFADFPMDICRVDGDVDLLLRLRRAPVVGRWVVVGDRLHGLLDQLVAFFLQAFPVAVLAGVDTATHVVVLGRRRRGPKQRT